MKTMSEAGISINLSLLVPYGQALTNAVHGTNCVHVLNAQLRLYLNTGDEVFVCSPDVCCKVGAICDAWEHRSLASETLRRELGIGHDSSGFLGSVDLRHNNTTPAEISELLLRLRLGFRGHPATYCAPASRALLIRSAWVILRRTNGDTPSAAIAAVELCMDSSPM